MNGPIMRLPEIIRRGLLAWAQWYMGRREPDQPIGGDYLHRWWVTPWRAWGNRHASSPLRRWLARWPNVYVHSYGRSDYDRALHDHPWPSLSIILAGGYWEWLPTTAPRDDEHADAATSVVPQWRGPGAITTRSAESAHRIELVDDRAVITLFVTGQRRRQWGFLCPEGWRSSHDWTDNGGCD